MSAGEDYVIIRLPAKLATELYIQGILAKIMDLEGDLARVKEDMKLLQATSREILETLAHVSLKSQDRGGVYEKAKTSRSAKKG